MKLSINTTITLSLSKSLMGGSINFAQNMMFRALFENNTWITIFLQYLYTLHFPKALLQNHVTSKIIVFFKTYDCTSLDIIMGKPQVLIKQMDKVFYHVLRSFGQTCKKLSCTSSSITIYSKNAVQYLHAKGKQNPQNLTCLIQIVD